MGIYTACTWAMGDLYGYKVRYVTSQWQDSGTLPELSEIEMALSDADAALNWEAGNPEYLELKARVLYYRALVVGMSAGGLVDVAMAKALHLEAIALRPRWPYSWANLVLMKSYLNEFDEEYQHALSQAIRFGPWEQSVHITLAQAGAISWGMLSREQKRLYADNVQRGIVRSQGGVGAALDSFKKRSVVCAYLKRSAEQKRFCST